MSLNLSGPLNQIDREEQDNLCINGLSCLILHWRSFRPFPKSFEADVWQAGDSSVRSAIHRDWHGKSFHRGTHLEPLWRVILSLVLSFRRSQSDVTDNSGLLLQINQVSSRLGGHSPK